MNRRHFLAISGGAALGFAVAPIRALAEGRLSVVATTGMVADAVRAVGGAHVDVTALMGAGIDPHSYRQTRSDIVALTRADMVFWNGLFLEAQMEDLLLRLADRKPVIALGEAVPEDTFLRHADYEGRVDPHVWMVPELWANVVPVIRDALSAQRPDAAGDFAANAEAYLAEIDAVGAYARKALGGVPESARVLVTAHDAFGYFGRAYGFEVLGIQGISTDSEAGLNRIRELVDILVEREIGAVFVESSVSDRNVRALVEGAAARGHEVRVGGELFSDAMGNAGTYEGTYVGMIDHNATVIAGALGADVPPRGMSGKLSAGI